MKLCLSLHQLWHSCRARVYGEEMVSDFAFCNLWQQRFDRWPCSSPRRNQCRRGTRRPGRDYDPAQWACAGREMFQGPIAWWPIHEYVWYEARP